MGGCSSNTHVTNLDSRYWDVFWGSDDLNHWRIPAGQTVCFPKEGWVKVTVAGGETLAGPADQSFIIRPGGRLDFAVHGSLKQHSNDPTHVGIPNVLNSIMTQPRQDAQRTLTRPEITIMSFNYQIDGGNALRRRQTARYIRTIDPAAICFQEPDLDTARGLHHALEVAGSDYSMWYCGREWNGGGEISPILVSRRYLVADGGMFHLTDNGWSGMMCPDQGCPRHVTWVVLKAPGPSNQNNILLPNLHLDNKSPTSREKMVRDKVLPSLEQCKGFKVVIAGDLNEEIGSDAAKLFLEDGFQHADPSSRVKDSFVGWSGGYDHSGGSGAIDHIFSKGFRKQDQLQYLPGSKFSGVQLSDHIPIHVTFAL